MMRAVSLMNTGPDLRVALVAAGSAAAVGALSLCLTRIRRLSLHVELVILVLTSVLAVAVGTAVAARQMYLQPAELNVVLELCAVCALVATVVGLLHARRIVGEARAVRDLASALVDLGSVTPGAGERRPRTTELAQITDELLLTGRRLAESRAREQGLEASRRELVAWVSHDLRAPLAGLRALVEALEDGVAEHPDVYVKRIGVEVARLGDMVSELFELSRLQAGSAIRHTEPVLVHDLVSDTLAGLEPLARARGIDIAGSSPAEIRVDADLSSLLRALGNLAGNGIRHTPAGGAVTVHAHAVEGHAWIEVTDGCGGIAPDVLPRVFEVGFRGTDARTPGQESGSGLGLAIVASIAEGHGGSVAVDNVDNGCRFRMRLPLAVSKPDLDESARIRKHEIAGPWARPTID